MTDYLNTRLTDDQLKSVSVLGLAHIGDGVYELLVRTWLCANGKTTSKGLHLQTVRYVSAPAQARAVERILEILTEDERNTYKRGRNAKVNSVPKHADISQYHSATGLEALFGYLYLSGQTTRINELFDKIVEE